MKFAVAVVCILLSTSDLLSIASTTKDEDIPKVISNEIKTLTTSRKASHELLTALKDLENIKNTNQSTEIFCQTCHMVIDQILEYRKSGANRESMISFFKKLCNTFTDWGSIACDGYIDIEIDTVLYIIDNKKDLTPERVCAIKFQNEGCTDPSPKQWNVDIPPLPTHRHENVDHQSVRSVRGPHPPTTAPSPWKLLHLTDFHYDPLYKVGNEADCGIPLCCQISNGPPSKPENAAGYWGDYHVCDTPWHSVTDFMNYVTAYHKHFDFIYYTGDIVSHRSWATTKDDNAKAISDLFQLFNDTFKETPVYPILGNHEPHPTDFYSPSGLNNSKLSTHWLFDLVAVEWAKWLPNDTQETIRKGGYYTVLVKPGFRVIALNSNVCYTSNLWLIYDDDDPYGQLKWLVQVLTQAEKDGERVHILSHIPPGELQCWQQWTYQFRKIVNRFAKTISAHFNGHTHFDELRIFYDLNNTQEVNNVAFNGGSFTTFVGLNPNYRVYDVDESNYTVLDYDHYTYNLTEANQHPSKSPRWYKLYSFKEAYGLSDTTFNSLDDLMKRMSKDRTLLQKYYKYQVRNSDPQMSKGCDDACLNKLLCSITAVEASASIQCQQLRN